MPIDLVIGQIGPREADWTVKDGDGPAVKLTNVPPFVTSTGGDYFFSPSTSSLNVLASPDIVTEFPDHPMHGQ